jgi:multiple sugar transport system ATP-binding protein
VYDAPRNLFVARFIGSPPMNTLAGTFTVDAGTPAVDVAGTLLPVTPPPAAKLEAGQPVVLGVRPEHLFPDTDGLPAIVRAVEWLGSQQHVIAEAAGETVTVALPPDRPEARVGSEVHLRASPAAVHLFDPETTERLA